MTMMTTTIQTSIDDGKLFVTESLKRKGNLIKNKERDRESIGIIKIETDENSQKQDFIDLDFQLKTLNMYNLILQSSHSPPKSDNDINIEKETYRKEVQVKNLEIKVLHYSDSYCSSNTSSDDYNQFLTLEESFPIFENDEAGVTDDEDKENCDVAIFEIEL